MRFQVTKTKEERETINQMAFDYAMYMIATSYFDEVACNNSILTNRLYLRYAELKAEKQFVLEEQCIRHMEEKLLPRLPKQFLEAKVTVKLLPVQDSNQTALLIQSEFGKILMVTRYRGKNSKVSSKLYLYSTPRKKKVA